MPILTLLPTTHLNKRYKPYGIKADVSREHLLSVRLEHVEVALANALRRIMVDEIETWAFPDANVKLHFNTSQYQREVLIKRLGFLTLNANGEADFNDLVFALCDAEDLAQPLQNTGHSILKVTVNEHLYVQKVSTRERIPTQHVCPYNSFLLTLNPGEGVHAAPPAFFTAATMLG